MGLTLNKGGIYCCAICQATQATVRGLSNHVLKKHSMEARVYYDTYVKLESEGICKICGKPTKFHTIADGYRDCCSRKCANRYMFDNPDKRAEVMAKREATCMERYGVTNGGASKEALAKANATNLTRRGVLYPTQCKDVIEKSKETCLSKYGTTTYVHSAEGTERVTDTVMEKFKRPNFFSGKEGNEAARAGYMEKHGYDHNMHDPVFLEKWKKEQFDKYDGKYFVETDKFKELSRETQFMKYDNWYSASAEGRARYQEIMLEKHGVPEYFQSDEFKHKSEATLMKEYNVSNYAQTPMWKDQVKATSLEKYGAEHYSKSTAAKADAIAKYESMISSITCHVVGMDSKYRIRYVCDECGKESIESWQFLKYRTVHHCTPCTHCLPKNPPVSIEEHEVTDYIESLGFTVTHYDRGFLGEYGADIVIEDKKLIVEYDGIFWHSELFKHSTYHLEKTMLAAEKGYRMVHIFSDEWVYRKNIVKNRLAMLLGKYSDNEPIAARDCTVGTVSSSESEKFLDGNHLQGYVNAKWTYGLYHDNKLVALMSFGTNRYGKGIEMFRYCPLMGYRIQGGAGKLFSHFVKENPEVDTITSFADARWSTDGAFYTKLGFAMEAMSDPGYFLVDGDIRRNRMQFQRHKIAGPDDDGKSENDITLERGLYRIYDCGQYRYVWHRG